MSKKYLYYFSEGNKAFGGDKTTMKNILGGKGAGLAEMTAAGMPVPQGFTITTEACTQYYADGRQINDEITADIFEHVKGLEEITGKKFGDNANPLLVSVRSGARQSMPGMMDTKKCPAKRRDSVYLRANSLCTGTWETITPAKTRVQPVSSEGVMVLCRISQPPRAANTDSRLIISEAAVGSSRF